MSVPSISVPIEPYPHLINDKNDQFLSIHTKKYQQFKQNKQHQQKCQISSKSGSILSNIPSSKASNISDDTSTKSLESDCEIETLSIFSTSEEEEEETKYIGESSLLLTTKLRVKCPLCGESIARNKNAINKHRKSISCLKNYCKIGQKDQISIFDQFCLTKLQCML